MLIGQYQSGLSPKRRVAIPKSFRVLLGNKIIIAKWYETCLVAVSVKDWEKIMYKLTAKAQTLTQSVRDTDRFILGSAFELIPDEQGRVVLPEILATYAGLGNIVTFLGLGDRVEIWDKTLWDKRQIEVAKIAGKLLEKIAEDGN